MTGDSSARRIGLALSGGGVRAAAFHAGVLRYLAERAALEDVIHISSVSGGSLFTGLIFKVSGYRWPDSPSYLNDVFPHVRAMLTGKSLQLSAIARLTLNPMNWRFALSRANVLAQAIEALWGVDAPLQKLQASPVWSINCTTGETGRRFRFKNKAMGDYELGYANVDGLDRDNHVGRCSGEGFGRWGGVAGGVAAGDSSPPAAPSRPGSTMADRIKKRSATCLEPALPTNRFASTCPNANITLRRSPPPRLASVCAARAA
ncbi:patatin-like phospholipase family protein [Caballeronia sp. LZ001]|uniref:patatin-like phospholipase family protein n=1 Tax=Caballeronia sp. LZ001 TaxID=3038553 RepID=UPI0038D41663